ncbi:MAG: CRISPR-associated endoribonuclease Cas6 [Thermoflexibacter sp.]|jgi:CRISPR-associated endoribonuclease Cas6|nr:CRISPR-associated endoribonuclease Cas6 [Thermoflexibacter sp.]
MIFKVNIERTTDQRVLPINYQYELSSKIYKILQNADSQYSQFLHEKGYQSNRKSFKLFAFSNLTFQPPFRIDKDRIELFGKEMSFQIAFYVDKTAENFIMGLFKDQQFKLGDKLSQVSLAVKQITAIPLPEIQERVILRPLSPVVIGKKNEKKNDDYLPPYHPEFGELLINNLIDKYQATGQSIPLSWQNAPINFKLLDHSKLRSKLVTIKANTPAQTKVKGFENFTFELIAPKELTEIALLAGVGKENAMGFGYCEVVKG